MARRKITGDLPQLPWIPYNAMKRLDDLLQPDWHMIEFGSGSSTAWYASRVASVHSIESDPHWFETIAARLPENVHYELRVEDDYADLSEYEDESVDFVVVDGIFRDRCVSSAIPKVRAGGWIYLDNSDKDMTIDQGHVRIAEQLLQEEVKDRRSRLEQRCGLAIGMLVTNEWTLCQL